MTKTTETLAPDENGLARAGTLIREGRLVAFPTETVYGLGADATNSAAVAAIYSAKARPQFNPLIVHVSDLDAAGRIGEMSGLARDLAGAFWPGPLTLVVPLRPDARLSRLSTAGNDTVALRVPGTKLARALIAKADRPVAAPSANPSGRLSPTTADHVLSGLSGVIEAVVDGGACAVGVESTIVGLLPDPVLLRPGGLPTEAIEAALGRPLGTPAADPDRPVAPGMLASHYAPAAPLRMNAEAAHPGEVLVGFGDRSGDLTLSASGDLTEAAARLFDVLHALDDSGATAIAVAPIPERGLGRAINDRLRRAAAPRER